MPKPETTDLATFESARPLLMRIAYRMVGSVVESEDLVQEAYLRWQASDAAVRDPEAFLRQTIARLSLDHLKSARVRREKYVGPWLPEPWIEPEIPNDVTLPLMVAMERLSPLERASFLLHDVFDLEFEEIAKILDRSPVACRQLASRARTHLEADKPRFTVTPEQGKAMADAFYQASRTGDMASLQSLLAKDAVFYSDGGGKVAAALNPIFGRDKIARLYRGLARKPNEEKPEWIGFAIVDGLPGYILRSSDGVLQVNAFEIADGQIQAVYVVRNPEKTTRVLL